MPSVEEPVAAAAPATSSTTKTTTNGAPSTASPSVATAAAAATAAATAAEKKISGAAAKAQAKAEKAAKRAQKKAETGGAATTVPETTIPNRSQSQQPQSQQKQKPAQSISKESSTTTVPGQRIPPHASQSQAKSSSQRSVAPAEKSQHDVLKESKNVALFGHLYTHPRRTTIAGASKDVHPAVLALGLQMSNYVVCGSSARCVATLLAFKRIIESYVTPPGTSLPRNLTALLSPQIEYLVSCRPLSTSTGNAIRWLKLLINDVDIETPEEKAKSDLCEAIDSFIRERISVADQVIATIAAAKISDGDVILTYAKSHVVAKALLHAHSLGTKFKVIIIDSRPLFEGKNLARTLARAGLDIQYSLTHAISHLMKDVTKVFLGAHAMFSNGRLYSRIGTALVAMTAHSLSKPVIVCCESIKFTDRVALDSIITNEVLPPDELLLPSRKKNTTNDTTEADEQQDPLADWKDLPNLQLLDLMYDVTPAHYIAMVITEHGSLPPTSVMSIHVLSGS